MLSNLVKSLRLQMESEEAKGTDGKEAIKRIEKVQGWEKNGFLKSLHGQASKGKELSDAQMKALEKVAKETESKHIGEPDKKAQDEIEKIPGWKDDGFLKSVHKQAGDRSLSPKQLAAIKKVAAEKSSQAGGKDEWLDAIQDRIADLLGE